MNIIQKGKTMTDQCPKCGDPVCDRRAEELTFNCGTTQELWDDDYLNMSHNCFRNQLSAQADTLAAMTKDRATEQGWLREVRVKLEKAEAALAAANGLLDEVRDWHTTARQDCIRSSVVKFSELGAILSRRATKEEK